MAWLVTTPARNVIQQQPFRRVRPKGRNNSRVNRIPSRWFVNELVLDAPSLVSTLFPRVTHTMESASIFTTLLRPARIEIGRNVIEVGELRRLNFVLFVPFVKRLFNGARTSLDR